MGTLRIKRGTKTALQDSPGYTPLEGELVYTTDTKEVFVGDGATTGGTPVSVSTQNLEDLGNVQALAAQNDQILVYNGSNWAATDNPAIDVRGNIYGDDSTLLVDAINGKIVGPIETTSISCSGSILGSLIGDTTGSHTGNVVGDTTGTHYGATIGYHTGDVMGSIVSDDSTPLIDSVAGLVTGNVNTSRVDVGNEGLYITGQGGQQTSGRLEFVYDDTPADSSTILGTYIVKDQEQQKFVIQTRGSNTYISHEDAGLKGLTMYSDYAVFGGMKLRINTANSLFTEPTADFQVDGDIASTGDVEGKTITMTGGADSFIQFGSLTTAERDALTAANGMVIYNSTLDKFQGYENGAWVNLV